MSAQKELMFFEVIDQAQICECLRSRYPGAERMEDLHHLPSNTFTLIVKHGELMRAGFISEDDLRWAAKRGLIIDDENWALVCGNCAIKRPAHREIVDRMKSLATQRAEAAKASMDELQERMDDGEDLSFCESCDSVLDELVPVRECSHCGDESFDASDGRNCVTCNRPFTRKICDAGCPECLSDEDIRSATSNDLGA